jgi:DNA-binding SARP family transcriptional activator/DNA-binding beta-propeller fold protein YncE
VEFRLLGPLDVVVDGRSVPLGGIKQRTLLAILVLHANEVVPTDRLIDELWPDGTPASALATLQGYVSRLRKALDPDRGNGGAATIAFRPPGYVLTAFGDQIDAYRFEQLVAEAEARASSGAAAEAAALLRDALALWRGAALSDFAYEQFAQAEIARLDELRLKANEDRIDAELACGRHAALVAELEALVAQHPLRERLRRQLMLALYRSGRQSEALDVYRDARKALHDELGLEPTRALSELERSILQQDRSLDLPTPRREVRGAERRRYRIAIPAAIAAAAAAAVGFTLWPRGSDRPVAVSNNSVAVVDARTDRIVDDVVTGDYPGPLVAAGGSVWVGNTGDNTIMAIDAKTRARGFADAVQQPLDLAVTGDRLWIANGTSFASGRPTGGGTIQCRGCRLGTNKTVKIGPRDRQNEPPATVASDGKSVWAADGASRTVYQLNARAAQVAKRVRGVDASAIAIASGALWAAEPMRGDVVRIDERTAKVVARIDVPGDPTRIVAGVGGVWVTTPHPKGALWRARSTVVRIDPRTNKQVATIAVPATSRRVATGGGYLWVTSGTYQGEPGVPATGGVVSKIDPHTNRVVATIKVGFRPDGIIVSNGLVWVAVAPR